jgi:RNA polymerase sigma-70 factor (ECF subfamily)
MGALICEAVAQSWTDEQIIRHILEGEVRLYELLVRRYNQRVYRAVRAILRDDAEAEDVMQEAHIAAYRHLRGFEGRSSYATWLTRIAVNEALARSKKNQRVTVTDFSENEYELMKEEEMSPEAVTSSTETRVLLEQSILALPIQYRSVVILRDVEEMSTEQTAAALDLTEEAVKVRLHRARALLRKELFARVGATSSSAFEFHAVRCDRVTEQVMRCVLMAQQ